jgi:hypothetical protein
VLNAEYQRVYDRLLDLLMHRMSSTPAHESGAA